MSSSALFRPTFTDLRAEIERRVAQNAPSDEIAALIDGFLEAGGDAPSPVVEYDGAVTWLFRSASAQSVSVVGDVLGYDPATTRMARLPGCDLFYLTAQLPLDAQIAYAFAVDVPQMPARDGGRWLERCVADPLNPRQMVETHPLRVASVLEMPGAAPPFDLDGSLDEAPVFAGVQVVWSAALHSWRRLWVYLPPQYDPETRRYPAAYFLDGEAYLLSARLPLMLDVLIEQDEIAPLVAVMVECEPARSRRVSAAALACFVADEVAPWIDARYATSSDPVDRIIGGAGAYGAQAVYTALQRPDMFGGLIAQSPGVQSPGRVTPLLARNRARGYDAPRCYVDVGRYDDAVAIETTQALCTTLVEGGAAVSYQDFAGGRGFSGWRVALPDALRFHFGSSALSDL